MISDIPLLVVGGAPVEDIDDYRSILGRAALIIAVDGGADLCVRLGIDPAILVGDMDSISPSTLGECESAGVRIVRLDSRKDVSDLHAALDLCAGESTAAPALSAISGGRVDHLLAALGTLAAHAMLAPRILEPKLEGWILAPTGRSSVTLTDTGATVSVIPLLGPACVTLRGMRYPLERTVLTPLSDRGLSNVTVSCGASVAVHEGTVAVLVPAQE